MKRLNNAGSHIVAIVVAVAVVGIIGFAGFTVWQRSNNASTPTTTAKANTSAPGSINSTADLTQAGKSLDDSASQVDGSLNDNNLNSDLNDLL